MRLSPWRVSVAAAILLALAWSAGAQSIPGIPRRGTPQRTAEQAPPVPTVMRPAEGEVVIGDLVVAVQVPPNVPARRYTIEAGYWDPARNDWAYPGTLGDDFSGGTTATTRIAADARIKWNQKATRWKIHVRTTEPPGGWGPWREFTWQAAPAADRTAPAPTPAAPAPVGAPASTATATAGDPARPGTMVPGTTAPPPGQPETRLPPATPPTSPPERTGTNVPAVQQPPARTLPEPGPPDARAAPPPPPTANLPAVQQPPARTLPEPGPPDARTAPPTPPGTNLPAVQQPPATSVPAIQQPSRVPAIPNLPWRLPTSLPKARSGSPGAPPSAAQSSRPAEVRRKQRLVSVTRLAVWDGKPMPASNQRVYVAGPVDVDWAKKSLQWWFRGTTTAPTAATGKWRWEMSRAPFADVALWQPTPGIGYAGVADGVQFFIDLNTYAPRPPGWPVAVSASSQPQPAVGKAAVGPVPGGAAPTFSNRPGVPPELLGATPGTPSPIVKVPNAPLPVSLSLYIRVVPLDGAGNDADLPSNAVELRFGPAEKPTPFDPNPKLWPVVSFVSYRPVQGYSFDWQCWVEASKDITAPDFIYVGVDPGIQNKSLVLYPKGTTRNVCGDNDSNIVEDFVDAVGGFIAMLESFVDWVSKAYSDIKSEVASKLVSVIPGCSTDPVCKGAVQAGLNAGLAALGMPPDLPDFEQLQAMGEGYLLDAVAQQVAAQTGQELAGELAKTALSEFIDKGKEAMQGGGGGASPWVPDDSKQYKPLLLTLAVTNPSTAGATPAMYLEVSEPGGARYKPRSVAVPSLAPAQSVTVSVALDPVTDPKGWMELLPAMEESWKAYSLTGSSAEQKAIQTKTAKADAALKAWRTTYLTGVVNLHAALKQPPFVYKIAYETSCFANQQGCLVQKGSKGP